jgi:hypothetical protein
MMLGAVTYNVLKNWDLETIITNLEKLGYEAVELRTGHKHGVGFRLLQQNKYDRYTLCEAQESKEPERFLQNYKALWTELNRKCA